jgi:hypothetical protein
MASKQNRFNRGSPTDAGHSYQNRFGADGSSKTSWIKDNSTGEAAGGYAP